MGRRRTGLVILSAMLLAAPAAGAEVGAPVSGRGETPAGQAGISAPETVEQRSVTRHSAQIGGHALKYTAVAGTLTLRDDSGKPTASMFYVAYLLGSGDARRPVTFFYNGGPGSSTLWLHMASFGPRRVVLNAPYPSSNPPYAMVDNDDSLLPYSDIVFLDAINTGFSRPLGDAKPETFMTADADIDIFTRGIERFLTINGRWNSPKYLFGESYGTSRSAGVANRLQKDGVQLNGLIQLGSILDIGRLLRRGDEDYIATFPTMAMTAVYHGKAPKPADQAAFTQGLRDFVEGPYSRALIKGNLLDQDEKRTVARQMAAYTGIDEIFFVQRDLRVSAGDFQAELLRDQRKTVGELDTRFASDVVSSEGKGDFDPSWSDVFRPMIALWNVYVRDELKFDFGSEYRRAYPGTFEKFDFRRKNSSAYGYFGKDLAQAMVENPKLQVYSLNGLYDLSTVFYGADLDYHGLRIPASLVSNLRYFYYPAGHMAYIDDASRRAIARDVAGIYADGKAAR